MDYNFEEMRRLHDIHGFPDYQITKDGQVFSTKRSFLARPLKLQTDTSGYPSVKLRKDMKTITIAVHRLMGITFFNGFYREQKLEVNHIDGCKTNNNIQNLELVTHRQNIKHAWARKLIKAWDRSGALNPAAKLTEKDVRNIRLIRKSTNATYKEIAQIHNISGATIYNICKHRTWRNIQ